MPPGMPHVRLRKFNTRDVYPGGRLDNDMCMVVKAGRTIFIRGQTGLDLDNKFLPYMEQHGIDTMLVRPDFYLYGAVSQTSQINALVDDLANDLHRHGVHLGQRRARQPIAA